MNPNDLGDPALRSELRAQAYATLRRHDGYQEHLDDAVQECLMRAQAKLAEYDPKKATFAGWVHGIMWYVLKETGRKLGRRPPQSDDTGSWPAVETCLQPDADRGLIHKLLAKLSPANREIVTLHHLEEWSHADIAANLKISPSATRVRLCRAMAELKQLAAQEGDR